MSLTSTKKAIESLNKTRQIEILKIFLKNNVNISENNNGTFINLTELDNTIIEKLDKYISYVNEQENQLNEVENEKTRLENIFFKDNKDNIAITNTNDV